MSRFILLLGAILIVIGFVLWLLERTGFRGLPGDLRFQFGNVRIYFPIVTSIVLSIILTLILWIITHMKR